MDTNIYFKIIIFLVVFIFSTIATKGNWGVGAICAFVVLLIVEVDDAYRRGYERGKKEHWGKNEISAKQADYINKIEKDRKKEEGKKVKNTNLGVFLGKDTSEKFKDKKSVTLLPIGLDEKKQLVLCDMKKIGGILIGGETGSGKSTFLYSTIAHLTSKYSPEEVKLLLIDAKRVEFTGYRESPFLITDIVVDREKASHALEWIISEISRRKKEGDEGESRIFILIDEVSDFVYYDPKFPNKMIEIVSTGKDVGIYIIITTSRPSIEIYTPELKSAFKAKIAFRTASEDDSRTILGQKGARQLAGRGQMLYSNDGIVRLQGSFAENV